jgi:hypothetical protein
MFKVALIATRVLATQIIPSGAVSAVLKIDVQFNV